MNQKLSLSSILALTLGATLWNGASFAQSLQGELNACLWLRDEGARLRCFEDVTRKFGTSAPESPQTGSPAGMPDESDRVGTAPPPEPEGREASTAGEDDRFGLPVRREAEPEDFRREMVIAAVTQAPRGEWILRMENGQVWRQTDNTNLPQLKPGMSAVVEQGFLGSLMMKINKRSFRVKREQ